MTISGQKQGKPLCKQNMAAALPGNRLMAET
jgi:hypothetical protein